ncbi:Ada metal-binding domain-containing protein [Micromonospora coerulea]|uniref:Ada metal-binding domain-containing protein n=1 Tax=Micromonospora coerulea TaxID=47856 RepID=UPI003D15A4B5
MGHRVAPSPSHGKRRLHPTAASAQLAGYRACKRCSPDAAPPARPAPGQSTLVGRAGAFIEDGGVNRGGIDSLVHQLGRSIRDVEAALLEQAGAETAALVRAPRMGRAWVAHGSRRGSRSGHRILV